MIYRRLQALGQFWANRPLRIKGLIVVAIPFVALLQVTALYSLLGSSEEQIATRIGQASGLRVALVELIARLSQAQATFVEFRGAPDDRAKMEVRRRMNAVSDAVEQVTELNRKKGWTRAEQAQMARIATEAEMAMGRMSSLLDLPPGINLSGDLVEHLDVAILRLRGESVQVGEQVQQLVAEQTAWSEKARYWKGFKFSLSLLLGLVSGIFATLLFTQGVARRIRRLEESSRRLAQGLPIEIGPAGSDEIGRLERQMEITSQLLAHRAHALQEDARRLQESEERFRQIAENIQDVFWMTSPDGRERIYVSPAYESIWGRSAADLAEKPWQWVHDIHPRDRQRVLAAFSEKAARGDYDEEYRIIRPDGAVRWIKDRGFPIRDAGGKVVRITGIAEDITDRKRAEQTLRKAKDEAEAANRAKSDFLSRISHELRTPMNAILGFAQLLELEELTADQRDGVQHILAGGHHLLDLMNEVLDIARIESGRMSLTLEPVRLSEVLGVSIDLVIPLAGQRQITFNRPAPGTLTRCVHADRQRLKQVMINLLSNAIKYNRPGGSVTVAVEDTSVFRLRIRITDTGPGISPSKLPRLFSPFDRLGAENGDVEGTGIGLVLSKRLVEAMGGAIEVESAVGMGSTFSIKLPLAGDSLDADDEQLVFAEVPSPEFSQAAPRAKKVVCIEDNAANFKLIERTLAGRSGITLVHACLGSDGVEMARNQRPDLVLLDLMLPDINGREVLDQLRRMPETSHVPVVVISADAMATRVDEILAAGALAYFTKPLNVPQFLGLVDHALAAPDPSDEEEESRSGAHTDQTLG